MSWVGILAAVGLFLDSVPIIRSIWRWALERQLSIEILPRRHTSGRDKKIYTQVVIEPGGVRSGAFTPFINLGFGLRLINNRADRKERIIGADAVFKKNRLWLWKKEFLRFPVCEIPVPNQLLQPISDIEIEPMSAPLEIQCYAESGLLDPAVSDLFPRHFNAYLELNMVGPLRHLERLIMGFERPGFNLWDRLKPGW